MTNFKRSIGFGLAATFLSQHAMAADFTVQNTIIKDQKAVFGTVESKNIVPARVRTGGTIVALLAHEGDKVERDQIIALIGDPKLALQHASLDAQIEGLKSQLQQADGDLKRSEELLKSGASTKVRVDELRTAVSVANNALRSRTAERSVLDQQLAEGKVLAPTAGRILKVNVTVGTVVLSGEPIAQLADQDLMLRIRVPERHARFLKVGDQVRIAGAETAGDQSQTGSVTLVYPQIQDGRVIADAKVQGLSDYFVGERIRVWIAGGERQAIVIPGNYIQTRFVNDYVSIKGTAGAAFDVPVQRGQLAPQSDIANGVEILTGLKAGDIVVQP
jgi:RND family efflux transporter MFP subunit